jgi:hypothetical protein
MAKGSLYFSKEGKAKENLYVSRMCSVSSLYFIRVTINLSVGGDKLADGGRVILSKIRKNTGRQQQAMKPVGSSITCSK